MVSTSLLERTVLQRAPKSAVAFAADACAASDAVSRGAEAQIRAATDAAGSIDTASGIASGSRALAESVAVGSDGAVWRFGSIRFPSDAVVAADVALASGESQVRAASTAAAADGPAATRGERRSGADAATSADAARGRGAASDRLGDLLAAADAAARSASASRSCGDRRSRFAQWGSSRFQLARFQLGVATTLLPDAALASDLPARVPAARRGGQDASLAADLAAKIARGARIGSDGCFAIDLLVSAASGHRSALDRAVAADAARRSASWARALADAALLADIAASPGSSFRALVDPAALADVAARLSVSLLRLMADDVAVDDGLSVTGSSAGQRFVADGASAADRADRGSLGGSRQGSDAAALADAVVALTGRIVSVADVSAALDLASGIASIYELLADAERIADAVARVGGGPRAAADAVLAEEVLHLRASGLRTPAESAATLDAGRAWFGISEVDGILVARPMLLAILTQEVELA